IFRVHPDIRPAETRTYCIGGPAHSRHVVAQIRVAPAERFDLDLALSDGTYRVRGPQLPFSWDFAVDATGPVSRWTLSLPGDLSGTADREAQSQRLRSGRQKLIVQNNHDQELVVRVERSASREDALTAARATALALFRELFPGEVLDSGQLVSITAITF